MFMRIKLLSVAFFVSVSFYGQTPNTHYWNAEKISAVKEQIKQKNEEYIPAYKKLLRQADKELPKTIKTVMDKELMPPSGDKHDYVSMGPYWWADPSKPDGIPYIRKDGQRNPELDKLDRNRLGEMSKGVISLSLAYYFSNDEKYASKAVDNLRKWFLNKDTRMNPNLNFGQYIPGHNNNMGRPEGIIDAYSFVEMLDAVQLLSASSTMTKKDMDELKNWFSEYLDWLLTSEIGQGEYNAKNNHSIVFDAQATAVALFVGRQDVADKFIAEFPAKRLFVQIEPDGSQPLELARTLGFHYSLSNIEHTLDIAALAGDKGKDLFLAESPDGRSITKATDFLLPYLGKPQSAWPYQQIKDWDKEQAIFCWLLRRASVYERTGEYMDLFEQYCRTPKEDVKYLLF